MTKRIDTLASRCSALALRGPRRRPAAAPASGGDYGGEHPDYAHGPGRLAGAAGGPARQAERAAARRHRRLREADRRAAGLPGRGQRLGLLVRALPLRVPDPAEALRPLRQAGRLPRRQLPGLRRRRRRPSSPRRRSPTPATPTPTRRSPTRSAPRSASPTPPSTTASGKLVYLKQGPYADDAELRSRRSRATRCEGG